MSKTPAKITADRKVVNGKVSKSETTAGTRKSKAKSAPQRTAVVVLGMHRSGTSALSGVLHLMGCDTPATPMKTATENEKGFFESALIHQLHNELLASAGTRWDDWLPINPGWYDSVRATEFHEQATDLLNREFGTSRLFVFKDPRICRLVPFWEDALAACDVTPRFVLTHRNPVEVANSLSRRNEIDQGLGILIWLRHVLDAEAATRGKTRCFVSYDGLLENWAGTMQRIQDEIELPLPRLSVGVASEAEAFLDIDLRHHRKAPAQTLENPLLPDWVRDAYAVLEKWAAGAEDKADYKTLDAVRGALTSSIVTFDPVIQANRKAKEELLKTFSELNEVHETLGAVSRDRDVLQDDQARTQEELANLRAELESTIQSRDHEVAELSRVLQENEQKAMTELADQKARGDLAEEAFETIRNSTSWRLTRPVRWVVGLVRN